MKISCICSLEHSTWSAPFAICTSPIINLVCPPKFCIAFAFNFSWVSQSYQDNDDAKCWGSKQGVLWEICKWELFVELHAVPLNDPKKLYGRKSYPVFYSFSKWQIVTVFPQQLPLLDHAYLKVKLNCQNSEHRKWSFPRLTNSKRSRKSMGIKATPVWQFTEHSMFSTLYQRVVLQDI